MCVPALVRPVAFVILVTLLAVAESSHASSATVDDYVITSWTETDGLWASYVRAIAQDRDGYLWLGTENGLVRFDGVRFTLFQGRDAVQLPQRSVVNLCMGRGASLWVGFGIGGGLSQISGGHVTNHNLYDGFVNGCAESADGSVWVATRGGLHRWREGRWERLGAERGIAPGRIFDVHVDRTGVVWIASAEGILRLRPRAQLFERVSDLLVNARSFVESADGAVWVADRLYGINRVPLDGRPTPMLPVEPVNVSAILHDRDGNLWIGTFDRGLWLARRTREGYAAPTPMGNRQVLASDTVYAMFEDRERNIWVSTPIGVHKLSPRRLTPITGLGVVRAVQADGDGAVWVATADGLLQLHQGRRRTFGLAEGLPSRNIRSLHRDPAGVLWVATDGGIARWANGRFHAIPNAPATGLTAAFASDGRATLWIRDVNLGLLRWTKGSAQPFNPAPSVPHTSVDLVAADRRGRVWLTITGGGIGVIQPDGRFELIRAPDPADPSTLAIHEDQRGAMWFGSGAMLSRLDDLPGEPSARISTGYAGDVILSIIDDSRGDIWLGMSSGIVHLPREEFDKAAKDSRYRMQLRHYGSSDGAAGLPVRIAYPSIARRSDGRLVFVTANGLTSLNPERLIPGPAPPVRIEQLAVDGKPFDLLGDRELAAGTSSVHIDYTASTFISPDRVQFRYKLEGFDADWVDAGNRREAFYTNLAPGSYRFQVAARSAEGVWTPRPAALEFTVLPAFYQTYAFYLLCVSVVVLGVIGAWQFRLRQVRREFALVLGERVRLSREIHDTLLQSLVGVGLGLDACCATLGASASPERAKLARLRQQVARYIRDARQRIWDLRSPVLAQTPLPDALRDTAELALTAASIRLDYKVGGTPAPCRPQVEQQLLSIGQEAVANVIRHARASRVRISLEYWGDGIRLTIGDDGCGFDVRGQSRRGGNHCGLLIMQERAEQIGARFGIVSYPGAGAQIEVFVPASALHQHHEVEVA